MRYYDLDLTPTTGKTYIEQNDAGTRIEQDDASVSIYFNGDYSTLEYTRYFDDDGYPQAYQYALDDDGARYSLYLDTVDDDGIYQPDTDSITAAELQETYEAEYIWAVSELSDTDTEVAKCSRSSSRATATLNEWYAYQEALCDYAHYSSDDGYSITDMTDTDEDSDDYTFKYEYDSTEYIVSVTSSTGRPVAPT